MLADAETRPNACHPFSRYAARPARICGSCLRQLYALEFSSNWCGAACRRCRSRSCGGMCTLTGKEFASCWTKIARANEHLNALKDEMLAWNTTRPYEARRRHDGTGARHSVTIHICNPPPLERWSVISGDCVYALRCALDHFAYAVAVHESKMDPPPGERVLQFPIADTPEKFAIAVKRIKALSERMQHNIEAVQPYHRPHAHVPPLLGLLRDLDDIDKHRLLHIVVSRQAKGRISFTAVDPTVPVIPTSID